MSPLSSRTRGYAAMLCAAVLWSLIAPFTKVCVAEGLQPLEIAFWRALLGGLCFFADVRLRSGTLAIPVRDALALAAFGVVGVGVFYAALQVSIALSGAALAMILMYTAPVWVAVFARAFFGERITPLVALCVALGLLGAGLVCASGGSLKAEPAPWGIACGLLSGLCYALYFPFSVWLGGKMPMATLYAWPLLGGTAFLGALLFVQPMSPDAYGLMAWANLLGLGLVTNYLAYLAYGYSLRHIPQVQAAIIGNVEPVLATLWVCLLWDENFSARGWAGALCIFAAVLLLARRRT